MSIDVTTQGGETVIWVDRALDCEAAARLRALIRGALGGDPSSTVIVDLTHAHEVAPIALAALVEAPADVRSRVRFRGLSHHAARLLHHLVGHGAAAGLGA